MAAVLVRLALAFAMTLLVVDAVKMMTTTTVTRGMTRGTVATVATVAANQA